MTSGPLQTRSCSYRHAARQTEPRRATFRSRTPDGPYTDMRRIAALALAVAVVLLGAQRLAVGGARRALPATTPAPTPAPAGRGLVFADTAAASSQLKPDVNEADVAVLARRWVTALWTRAPGEAPFGWLDRVADITAPALLAELRSARPWRADPTLASTAEVDGVYPDAVDPATVTVTCVAHLTTAAGRSALPCAVTVTVARSADGRLVVAALR